MLIVEDQPLIADYMASIVEGLGMQVEVIATTAEFQSAVQRSAPQIILLDLAMPDGDGVQLLRLLAEGQFRGPILIVSACDERVIETSSRLAEELGLNVAGFAQKPITEDRLTGLIEQALEGEQGAARRAP